MVISTNISRNDSNVIKGIAILLMLYFHLFNRATDGVVDLWFQGQPLTKYLSPAAYPVPFFLMISGYGLYYSHKKGKLTFGSNTKRALKLYIHYWVVMLIFVSIGTYVASWHYPGTFSTFIKNVIGIHCTYNYETWFLLPYIVLSCLSPLIFKGLDKMGVVLSFFLAFFISYSAYFCTSRYVATGVVSNNIAAFSLSTLGLLFDFVTGACLVSYSHLKKNKQCGSLPVWLGVTLLIVLILLRCLICLPWSSLYALLFVLIFLNMRRIACVDHFLMEIGKKSMVMWMVHTYFSIYLFHDFIYGFKYPILIYLVLVMISYITSLLLMKLVNPLIKKINQ